MDKKMSKPNKEYVKRIIEKESFDYAFEGYSNFDEVEDSLFHDLRLNYLTARNELSNYLGL